MLDLLPLEIRPIPVVLNVHSTGTEVALIPRVYSCDYTEYWERRLMLLPESQWVIFEFRRNPQRQVMIDFIGCCIGCISPISSCRSCLRLATAGLSSSPLLSGHSTTQPRRRAWSVESAIPCSYWTMLFWLKRSWLQYNIVFVTSRSGIVGLAARGLLVLKKTKQKTKSRPR